MLVSVIMVHWQLVQHTYQLKSPGMNLTNEKIHILLLTVLLSQVALSQEHTQTVRGKVVDSQTEVPLYGVTVIIKNSQPVLGASTDVDGIFEINMVPVGRQTIEFSYIGYIPHSREDIFVNTSRILELEVRLEESVTALNEVIINARQNKAEAINKNAAVSIRTFSVEETERYSGSIGDPARMASNFAGIATICDQRNDIVIRGNSPLGVLWRLDGIDIPNPNHFASFGASGGPISILNNNLLTNSDFLTGAFPAEYGNALSGVFDLKMRYGSNQKYEFVAQTGMNGFELGAEGPIIKNKSSFLINYRYSTLAIVDAMGFKVGIDAIPYFQDASFKISSKNTKAGSFTLIGIGGYSYEKDFDSKKDTSLLVNGKGENYTFGSGMGSVALIHKLLIDKRINVENSIALSYTVSHISEDKFSRKFPNPSVYYRQKSYEKGVNFSTTVRYKPDLKNSFQTGLSFQILKFQFVDSVKSDNNFIVNINQTGNYNLLKSYFQWQHKFTDYLEVYNGMNLLFFTFNNSYSFEPRMGLKWNLSSAHSVNLGFGLHSQLSPRQFYVVENESSPDELDEFNKKLGFFKSLHLVAGYNWLLSENFRMKFETYYQYLYDIPVKKSIPAYSMLNFGDNYFNRLPLIDSLINSGTGRNYGIELTLEKFLTKGYYALVTTSLYESKYRGFDKIERNTAFNGNFIFNVLGGKEFRIGKNNYLSLNFKVTYAGSLRIVPYEIKKVSQNYYIQDFDWGNAYLNRRNDYFRLNGRFGYKLLCEKVNIELAIDFMNMTNHKDIFMESFNSETGKVKYSYQFPFLPIGFIRFLF